jgi:probable F420-dependent oxidoreductase
MKFGLFGINMGPCSTPGTAARVAQAAEEAGFESLWSGEHVVLPDPQVPPSPLPPDFPMLDPVVAFAFLAARTRTVRLGTGIIILPQRNPLVLAKELASLDVLSGGRLIFGVGIGYLKPEFDALGIPFDDKGPRTIDYLQAMRAIWSQPQPAYRGKRFSFGGVQALPRPVQQPHPPIVFGGMTPSAFRRAVRHGNGWYGFACDLEGTKRCLAGLREAAQATPRPGELGELEISVTPSVPLDLDTVKRFADLGVHRLIPVPRRGSDRQLFSLTLSETDVLDFVKQAGDTLVGRV